MLFRQSRILGLVLGKALDIAEESSSAFMKKDIERCDKKKLHVSVFYFPFNRAFFAPTD